MLRFLLFLGATALLTACSATEPFRQPKLLPKAAQGQAVLATHEDDTTEWFIYRESDHATPFTIDDFPILAASFGVYSLSQMSEEDKEPCSHNDQNHPHGTILCFKGSTDAVPTLHTCYNGKWVNSNQECVPPDDGN